MKQKRVCVEKSAGNDLLCVCIDKNSREMNKRRMKPIECRTSHFNKNHAHMRHAIRAGIPFIVTIKKKHKLTEKAAAEKKC